MSAPAIQETTMMQIAYVVVLFVLECPDEVLLTARAMECASTCAGGRSRHSY